MRPDRPDFVRLAHGAGLPLVMAYALSSLLLQGSHGHVDGHDGPPRAEAGCLVPGLHLASHPDAPDLSRGKGDCPACQLRSHQLSWRESVPDIQRPTGLARVEWPAPSTWTRVPLRPSGRAPPDA